MSGLLSKLGPPGKQPLNKFSLVREWGLGYYSPKIFLKFFLELETG